ncbi:MAG: hypothetical protein ACYS0I_03305 [Planctomycetota bacterium]
MVKFETRNIKAIVIFGVVAAVVVVKALYYSGSCNVVAEPANRTVEITYNFTVRDITATSKQMESSSMKTLLAHIDLRV